VGWLLFLQEQIKVIIINTPGATPCGGAGTRGAEDGVSGGAANRLGADEGPADTDAESVRGQ
jgi:hypothetical protein